MTAQSNATEPETAIDGQDVATVEELTQWADQLETERDAMIETISELERERDALRETLRTLRHHLQTQPDIVRLINTVFGEDRDPQGGEWCDICDAPQMVIADGNHECGKCETCGAVSAKWVRARLMCSWCAAVPVAKQALGETK
jgi:hypothetical protein